MTRSRACTGSSTSRGSMTTRENAATNASLRPHGTPTHGRGHRDSLDLRRRTLSFPSSCRLSGAFVDQGLGPPAWDHAALMTSEERWGGAAETYPDFARGYGADLRESSLAQELAALRLLAPTINMIINGASNRTYAAEAQARMRYWLGDPAAPTWTPH